MGNNVIAHSWVTEGRLLRETEYLRFFQQDSTSGKTKIVHVVSKSQNYLGRISWWGPWRQYVFHPANETLFNRGCLDDIMTLIKDMMEERKK